MRIGRTLSLDVKDQPRLIWEWKPLILPDGVTSGIRGATTRPLA